VVAGRGPDANHHDDGRLSYQMQFRRDSWTYLDTFPAERVRLDTVDRSAGRGQVGQTTE
jgi:hypothetical protein